MRDMYEIVNHLERDPDLKPCPFCGELPYVKKSTFTIVCKCGASMTFDVRPVWHKRDAIVEAWNTRAS